MLLTKITIMITKFTELLMCGHWEPKAAPCAIVVHFVNFIIIGFWLRITNNYLLLVYRLQNLDSLEEDEHCDCDTVRFFRKSYFFEFCFMIKLTPRRRGRRQISRAAAAEPKHPVRRRRPNIIGVGVYRTQQFAPCVALHMRVIILL